MVHEEAEVVAEVEHDVFRLKLVGQFDVIHQMLLYGLADGRLDLGGVDERCRVEAVLDTGLIAQLLDPVDALGVPFVQEIVRVVAA